MKKSIRRAALLDAPARQVTSPDKTPSSQLSKILAGWAAPTVPQAESIPVQLMDTPTPLVITTPPLT